MKELKSIVLYLFALITMVQSQSSPLKKNCGESKLRKFEGCTPKNTFSRIIGGVKVLRGEIPWQVLLNTSYNGKSETFSICGGSIISQNFVLTAAHCVFQPRDAEDTAKIGKAKAEHSHLWVGMFRMKKLQFSFKFERIIIHHHYSWKRKGLNLLLYNDIALVKVKGSFNFTNPNIQAICLPPPDFDVGSGTKVVVSGFGLKSSDSGLTIDDLSKVLRRTDLDIVNSSDSKCLMNGHYTPVNNSKICTFTLDHDACAGDSGGPVAMMKNGKCTVVGIISEGMGCADDYFGGLHTNVAFFVDWISNHLNE